MPEVTIHLDEYLKSLTEDVLMEVNKDKSKKTKYPDIQAWIRFKLREYLPLAYRNLQRYLRTGEFLGVKKTLNIKPLASKALNMPGSGKHKLRILLGHRQLSILRETVPFENAVRSSNPNFETIPFDSVADYVRHKAVNDLLEVSETILKEELQDEEDKMMADKKAKEKTKVVVT